jgi:hypothetical protein
MVSIKCSSLNYNDYTPLKLYTPTAIYKIKTADTTNSGTPIEAKCCSYKGSSSG